MNTWQVPYKPGKLEAIGYKQGKQVAKFQVATTSKPTTVQLIPDRNYLNGDGEDAMPITVQLVDAQGRHIPTANNQVVFEISNNAKIIGVGNGDPNSHEAEKGNQRSIFNGLAQVIIQSNTDTEGEITLTASVEGMQSATIRLPIRKFASRPSVPVAFPPMFLSQWRISPFSNSKPNANITLSDNDMNSWFTAKSSELVLFNDGPYALYKTNFSIEHNSASAKGKIVLKKLTGKAEIWLNNQLINTKNKPEAIDWEVPFTATNGQYNLTILIETEKGKKAGLGGTVVLFPNVN
jgi:beta-galactosidase